MPAVFGGLGGSGGGVHAHSFSGVILSSGIGVVPAVGPPAALNKGLRSTLILKP